MSPFARLIASICAGFVALFILKALGVPFWRWGWDIGDQSDGFMMAALLVWTLTSRRAAAEGKANG